MCEVFFCTLPLRFVTLVAHFGLYSTIIDCIKEYTTRMGLFNRNIVREYLQSRTYLQLFIINEEKCNAWLSLSYRLCIIKQRYQNLTCKFSPYNCRLWYSGNLTRECNILPFDYFLILWFRNPFRRNWIKARTCSKVDDEERGFGEHQKFNHCVVSRIFQHRCGFRLRTCNSRCCVCVRPFIGKAAAAD